MAGKIRGIEQFRAKTAYDFVKSVADSQLNDKAKGKYKSNTKKLPIYIKTNGLGQSLAFIRKREGWDKIYEQLTNWFQQNNFIPSGKDLVEEVIPQMESDLYRHMTKECLAFLNWMRRFVDGLIDVEES